MEVKNEMPTLDGEAMKDLSEEELAEYGRAYTEAVEDYVRRSVAESMVPLIEDMGKRERESEDRAALIEMRENEEYSDFSEKMEAVNNLISGMPALTGMDPKERYTAAYLMVKGAEAIAAAKAAPAKREPADIAEEVWGNAEVMRLLSERKAREADRGDLPVFSRSAAGAATVPSTPKTLADASARARKHFKI